MRIASRFLAFTALGAALFVSAANAADAVPFTQDAFAAAQASGAPILIDVSAPWCPVCAKQKPVLSSLEQRADFAELKVFEVDFDTQKDVLKALNVRNQSTLIAFHGASETARSTGVTDPEAIQALVAKTKA